MNLPVMTPRSLDWQVFRGALQDWCFPNGPESNRCNCSFQRPYCRRLLTNLGYDVEGSLAYFAVNGGACDCEVFYNVGAGDRPRPKRRPRRGLLGRIWDVIQSWSWQ